MRLPASQLRCSSSAKSKSQTWIVLSQWALRPCTQVHADLQNSDGGQETPNSRARWLNPIGICEGSDAEKQ
jgi:hypothetical protein